MIRLSILYIVNDGSTDQTARVLSEIKDSRIIIVDRDICRGVSQARNLGLSLARGDLCYVC